MSFAEQTKPAPALLRVVSVVSRGLSRLSLGSWRERRGSCSARPVAAVSTAHGDTRTGLAAPGLGTPRCGPSRAHRGARVLQLPAVFPPSFSIPGKSPGCTKLPGYTCYSSCVHQELILFLGVFMSHNIMLQLKFSLCVWWPCKVKVTLMVEFYLQIFALSSSLNLVFFGGVAF